MHNWPIYYKDKLVEVFFIFFTTLCRFSRKRGKFELQVFHSLLIYFFKIIFGCTIWYFNRNLLRFL
jgi:hypothetical protein